MLFFELKKLIFFQLSLEFYKYNSLLMSHAHISLHKSGTCFVYKLFTSIFTLRTFDALCIFNYADNVDGNVKIEKRRLFFKSATPSIPMNQREIGKQRNVYLAPAFPEQTKHLPQKCNILAKIETIWRVS